jgi:hypothetical protein
MSVITRCSPSILWAAVCATAVAQGSITSPKEFFGFDIGDDYQLATYRQFAAYWQKLDRQSDRMVVRSIGRTEEGRDQLMAIVSSPDNLKRLEEYRALSKRLALAKDLSPEEARKISIRAKAVVWIDGGLHATETLCPHMLIESVYRLLTANDPETLRILDDCIILFVHANPDGMELVSSWYMQSQDPKRRTYATIPRLYQKYIGHDNNRDFYAVTQAETRNMCRVLYHEWFPQIVYNHHQSGPPGTVLFAPPFRDPFNYHFDPMLVTGIERVGAAMHDRFARENKPGATLREGASFSTWWNGGLRTTAYFHNMIGLLTETIGSPTPMRIPFVAERQIPSGNLPFPVTPQVWHFRDSIEYSHTANLAVLDFASRNRDQLLYGIYEMGRRSIQRGSQDSWTITPKKVARVPADAGEGALQLLRQPDARDPRAYVIPADQPDFPTAVRLVNSLIWNGIEVQIATHDFSIGDRNYPKGTIVVPTAQAFRPHILDMFEPQDYPDDFVMPGAPPTPPYDIAGWTLAWQMGVQFDRILEPVVGPLRPRTEPIATPPGAMYDTAGASWFAIDHRINNGFALTNRLLSELQVVAWSPQPLSVGDRELPAGALLVEKSPKAEAIVRRAARELGITVWGLKEAPREAWRLAPTRVALLDRYGGSMESGWIRWILEQFEFPYRLVFPPELDAGNLQAAADVLILPSGSLSPGRRIAPDDVPPEWRPKLGGFSQDRTIPPLRKFLEQGGRIVAIGDSTRIAGMLGLPLRNALVERSDGGEPRPLPRSQFYIPGSLLEVRLDSALPVNFGLPERLDVLFDQSPAFDIAPDDSGALLRIGWYDSATPLRSGWAWGQERLKGTVAMAEAQVGRGRLYLFGPEITFRGQSHQAFKLLFNALLMPEEGRKPIERTGPGRRPGV